MSLVHRLHIPESPEVSDAGAEPWVLLLRTGSPLPLGYLVPVLSAAGFGLPGSRTSEGLGVLAVGAKQQITGSALQLTEALLAVSVRRHLPSDPDPSFPEFTLTDLPTLRKSHPGVVANPWAADVATYAAELCRTLSTDLHELAKRNELAAAGIAEPWWEFVEDTEAYRLLERPAVINSYAFALSTTAEVLKHTMIPEIAIRHLGLGAGLLALYADAEGLAELAARAGALCTAAQVYNY